ncbi:dynein axonemal intermediate chain 4-like isoform X3 [Biomphalaria glabrata]|uniref:Dynein axonemal intermediate chain 4 n=1 Tax=Biomphalaria glabrata TaxID=6526 RepID=A0A9W3AF01_BIOGL|nr:dynein axonemal intermediate chain 4-like isoform X3 [Biomphalaria glabrata]KAI8754279.1 WD repeat-containing protein 78-like [Biomphalaria glabrata]
MSTSKSKIKPVAPKTVESNHTKSSTMSQKNVKASAIRNPPFASSRSAASASALKKGIIQEKTPLQKIIQIFDDAGNDVTPLPLVQLDSVNAKKNQTNILGDGSIGTPTDLMSQTTASIYGQGTQGTSVFGGGPFTRSVFTQSYEAGSDSLPDDSGPGDTPFTEIRHKRQEIQEVPTEADLEKIVDITLTETETIWMFDLPDVKISTESEEVHDIEKRNKSYAELLKSRVGNDLYVERGMNTFNEPPKLKSVQTNKIELIHTGVECTYWDMYDTYSVIEKEKQDIEEGEDDEGTISRPGSAKILAVDVSADKVEADHPLISKSSAKIDAEDGRVESRATGVSSTYGSELQLSLEIAVELTEKEKLSAEWEEILNSEKFHQHLFLLERVVNLNTYQTKQALYRGFQPVVEIVRAEKKRHKDSDKLKATATVSVLDMGPNLDRLWSYTCHLTKDKNVSCMAWNRVNQDLLAVGYGQWEFSAQKSGLVCCWCIKNPEYPERVFMSKEGVTAVDFSTANPNLLAVGYYDGGIAVYNVRKSVDEPVLDNFTAPGKHLAPIWQLKWVEKERGAGEDKIEVLISISTDGRVTQWSIRKGFESYDVMKLKKMPTRMAGRKGEKKGEAFISRYAGGMCFDFHTKDSNIYLAGTEDGYVHRCSCSHNEQYLESYQGHTGPVYSIQWSPFAPDIFLTCSADWTIKLWHQDKTKHVLSFHSSTKAVNDICWSPWSSTVFACVNEAAVEVWDLAQSTLDPVYNLVPTSCAKQTTLSFSKNSQCLMVGDSEGQVTVYQLRCMPDPPNAQEQESALLNVIKSSLASQLTPSKEENVEQEGTEDDDEIDV